MNQPNRILPVVYGAIFMTVTAVVPVLNFINVFCCAGIIAGGFAGTYSYWKQLNSLGLQLTSKDGGMIGILSGILSAVFVTGFGVVISLFSNTNPMTEIITVFQELGVDLPPDMNQYIDKFSNEYSEHGFSPSITIFSFISNLILYPLFGSLGALIAVSVLNKRRGVQS